ncbi:MAG: type II secretion system F family protein [Planctomycetota bacterium]
MSSAATTETLRSPAAHEELALFHRTLAELCRAQVPLPRSLALLKEQLRAGPLRDATDAMLSAVEAGTPLDEAYANHRAQFPPLYCSLVEAGMVSGDLPAVLEEIARHASERAVILGRIRKALAYPLLTAVFVVVIGSLLGFLVAPRLWEITTWFDFAAPDVLVKPALIVLAGLIVGGAIFVVAAGPFGGRWRTRLPVFGRLRDESERAGYAATMALLLRRNVPLAAALDLAAATVGAPLAEAARSAANEAHAGAGLGEVLGNHALFEPALAWIVAAADGSSEVAGALEEVASIYRRRLDRAVDRVTTLIVPLAEIVLGAVVFLLAYAYVVPLFEWQRGLFGGP